MISTDFAANESWDDSWISIKLLFQPGRWRHGKETDEARSAILNLIHQESAHTSLFLTGRAALYYYLQALNLPKNTDVVIQAFTCEAVPLPIIANGLNPIYVDIEKQTFSMDIEDLKKKLTPNSKVLILQHTYGFTPKFRNEILTFAKEKNLIILEDLAHGWNTSLKIENTSSYLMSFGRSKAFSSVFGGAIVTTDKTIAAKLADAEKKLSMPSAGFIVRSLLYKPLTVFIKSTYDIYIGKLFHKILNALNLLIPEITNKEKQGEYDVIFAKAYPNALAILLLHQLKKYPKALMRRAVNAKHFDEYFKSEQSKGNNISRYPMLIENRNEVVKIATDRNIYLGKWYDQVVAPKQLDVKKVYYIVNSCPVAQSTANSIVNFPLNINPSQIESFYELLDK